MGYPHFLAFYFVSFIMQQKGLLSYRRKQLHPFPSPEVRGLFNRKTIDGVQSLVICIEYARIWFKALYEDTSDLEIKT